MIAYFCPTCSTVWSPHRTVHRVRQRVVTIQAEGTIYGKAAYPAATPRPCRDCQLVTADR